VSSGRRLRQLVPGQQRTWVGFRAPMRVQQRWAWGAAPDMTQQCAEGNRGGWLVRWPAELGAPGREVLGGGRWVEDVAEWTHVTLRRTILD